MQSNPTARDIAIGFVALCDEHGDLLTNLKIQKLLYFAQGWHLGLYGTPLFDDPMEAWILGPVVPSVFREFNCFGPRPIDLAKLEPARQPLSANDLDFLKEVWEAYGSTSAFDLERLAHQGRPWQEARNGLSPDTPSNSVLDVNVMREFFTEMASNA